MTRHAPFDLTSVFTALGASTVLVGVISVGLHYYDSIKSEVVNFVEPDVTCVTQIQGINGLPDRSITTTYGGVSSAQTGIGRVNPQPLPAFPRGDTDTSCVGANGVSYMLRNGQLIVAP